MIHDVTSARRCRGVSVPAALLIALAGVGPPLRAQTGTHELLDLEQRIARVDERINRVAQAAFDHVDAMEALGLDATEQERQLAEATGDDGPALPPPG